MSKKFITCGCSHSVGINQINENSSVNIKNYSNYIEELTNFSYIQKENISLWGGSNYSIVKQIEYAISLNPDVIIFNTTTPRRYDFTKNFDKRSTIDNLPTILDFNYPNNKLSKLKFKNKIQTLSIRRLEANSKENFNFKKIFDYLITYEDEMINLDKNILFFKSIFYSLEKSNIPFVCLDFGEILNNFYHSSIINISWKYMYDLFRLDNFGHFNEQGHKIIAEQIISKLKNF